MATTTATISINSTDLQSSPLSLSASTPCMQAGTTTGLDMVESGRGILLVADGTKTLKLATAAGDDTAAKVYLCNKATNPTYYIDVDIHDTNIGRLYAGDWMFIPWGINDVASEIVIEAEPAGATCPYEFALFQEPQTLVDHS